MTPGQVSEFFGRAPVTVLQRPQLILKQAASAQDSVLIISPRSLTDKVACPGIDMQIFLNYCAAQHGRASGTVHAQMICLFGVSTSCTQ